MQQQHRIALALVEVVHPEAVLLDVVGRERIVGEALEALVRGAIDVHPAAQLSTA